MTGLLKLQSRPGTFVCGEVVDGVVMPGMEILWPLPGDGLTLPVVVRNVDVVDYAPEVSGIALDVRFDDEENEHEQLLRDLLEVGMVVTVRCPPPTCQ